MYELKLIHKEAVPRALEKAERYRLLNEPASAVSICHDILAADPDNQRALVMLILALTDRFSSGFSVSDLHPQDLIPKLHSEYERAYYSGIILERRAKARLDQSGHNAESIAFDQLREAMEWYERAGKLCQAGNDDAALRWNTCARIIVQNKLSPGGGAEVEEFLE